MALLEKTLFDLLCDATSTDNSVPPPVTSSHLLGVPLPPLSGDVIYGWSLSPYDPSIYNSCGFQ